MIVPVFNYHSSIITIIVKNNKALYVNLLSNSRYLLKLIQNRLNRLVFFHEDKLFFYQKQLEKFLQTRVEGHGRSGCGRGGDPDLRETETGMWSCLSALFEEILCTVSQKMKPTLLRVGFIFTSSTCTFTITLRILPFGYREHGHLRGNRWRTVPDRSWCRL